MKKWLILLVFALLLHAGCVRAEEETYYTNNQDIYYHTDPDCDRPETIGLGEGQCVIYERECYQKYPISEEAASEFEKAACPICVKKLEPVYLGEYMKSWSGDSEPWGVGDVVDDNMDFYQLECNATYERFMENYQASPYSDSFAGLWPNCSGGYSYAIVDPTQEKLDAFKSAFGGGAWIVPAKYNFSYDYYSDRAVLSAETALARRLEEWKVTHPDIDLSWVGITKNAADGLLEIEMSGADWEEAMPVLDAELELPIWVCFYKLS